MDVGMLWLDNDPRRDLKEKVRRAVAHYEHKYGRRPNVCFVHPSMLEGNGGGATLKTDGVEVRPGRAILPDHFWLGMVDD